MPPDNGTVQEGASWPVLEKEKAGDSQTDREERDGAFETRGDRNMTFPANPRMFIFSPDVGGRMDGPTANRSVTPDDVEEVKRFGRGTLFMETIELQGKDGDCTAIERMTFPVRLIGGC